ncbi:MAG: PQQ-dependent dehydrogenase, methanol/ethanol family [Pseudomonadota bacterium]|nr:PQQ-dependent dehydrogenase, methanol/ethanol family [Porticoccaceae bacterium]MDP7404531.1 PQQ-dependent dehydrogenase, methanol/ethanol family [Porticoccaceae bacterium]MEC8498849.1 PQQ-dependent dehydrogenase, methanol/ethanol family [Pseudomonadota bacterium]|tara:strand:- start:2815 stop:5037 length:2223 start_codon:yes stop_codon:yes gene_type:complete
MKIRPLSNLVISLSVLILLSFSSVINASLVVNQTALINPKGEWLNHGRTYKEQRYSPLTDINKNNVNELDLAWSFKFDTARGMEATPILHDGVLYVSTGWSHVHAIDARSGDELWHYDAKVPKSQLAKTCCGPVNRGVAIWQKDNSSPLQIFFGSLDGRLIALDAKTGKENWSVQSTPTDGNYSITGAPRIVKDMVIIGNGGGELGVRGYITAYDVSSGEMRWRFYTVPGDRNKPQESEALKKALPTWSGEEWYKLGGGGGTVWDSIVFDPELDILYIGTGNGSPWNRDLRSPGGGDNLYLSSIVAINPDNGKYIWHYQTTPADNWDYTATQQMILAEIEINNEIRSVIMQAPKNGFFYVLDRKTGELISAEKFGHVTWATHVDMETGKPVESEFADYQENGGSYIWPSPYGAHNWQPMSYSKKTGYIYIPVQTIPAYFSGQKEVSYKVNRWNTGVNLNESRSPASWVAAKASLDALVYGELVAWDPIKQERAWTVRHPKPSNGGTLSTAGDLVFQGTWDGAFAAYDALSGDQLWQYQSDSAILAGPITYELDGEQYVAVTQGSGGVVMLTIGEEIRKNFVNQNRLLVFKRGDFNLERLTANNTMASLESVKFEHDLDIARVKNGEYLYHNNCASCHGLDAKSNYVVPDLRYMSEETHDNFATIVLGGSLTHKGMIGFYETLSLDDVGMIHDYLRDEQTSVAEKLEMTFSQKVEYWFNYAISKLGEKFPEILNATRDSIM